MGRINTGGKSSDMPVAKIRNDNMQQEKNFFETIRRTATQPITNAAIHAEREKVKIRAAAKKMKNDKCLAGNMGD